MAKKKMIQRNSLTALLIIGVLVICAPIAFAGWLRLEVHPQVNLGTIDAPSFNVEDLSFNPLRSTGQVSIQLVDGEEGLTGVLCVKLVSASSGVDTARFKWREGHQLDYTAFLGEEIWMEVARVTGAAWHRTLTMSYRYDPTVADQPNLYYIILEYRLRLYYGYYGGGWREQTIQKTVSLNWSADPWIILHILAADRTVALGTIDAGLFDPATEPWTPITSGAHSAWVATNLATFTLTITATLITNPAGHPNPLGILPRLTLTSADMGFHNRGLDGTLIFTGARGLFIADDIVYAFTPSFKDAPGDYAVTVTYTVTAN